MSVPNELSEQALVEELIKVGFEPTVDEEATLMFMVQEKAKPITVVFPGSPEKMITFALEE
jgi:hypothetical protein